MMSPLGTLSFTPILAPIEKYCLQPVCLHGIVFDARVYNSDLCRYVTYHAIDFLDQFD